MFARYLSLIQQQPFAAAVLTTSGRLACNTAASELVFNVPELRTAFEVLNQLTLDDGLMRSLACADGRTFSIAPLYDERSRIEGVLCADVPLDAMPRLLHVFQEPMRSFGRIVHDLPTPVATARPDGRFDFFNRRWHETFGVSRMTQASAALFIDRFCGDQREAAIAEWRRGIATSERFMVRALLTTPLGERWFAIDTQPMTERGLLLKWITTIIDIDEEVRASTALEQSRRQFEFIAFAASAIASATNRAELAAAVAAFGTDRNERWRLGFSAIADTPAADVVNGDDGRERLLRIRVLPGGEASLAVTMLGETPGRLSVRRVGDPSDLRADVLPLALNVATRVEDALERFLAAELARRSAEALQRAMLPGDFPDIDGLHCDVAYVPASTGLFVGGDWYDVFPLGEERVAFTIGDVAGHGVDAAIAMGTIRRLMRAAARANDTPADVLAAVSNTLAVDGTLASAVFGVLDILTGAVEFANAGHVAPYRVDRFGALTAFDPTGAVLGRRDAAPPAVASTQLEPGTALVLYTDGLLDAPDDRQRGDEALRTALTTWARNGFKSDAMTLHEQLCGGRPSTDDVAMLTIRLEATNRLDVTLPATPRNATRMRRAIERTMTASGVESAFAAEMTLAIAEAINNAAEYAYRGEPGPVHLMVKLSERALEATVTDRGTWRDGQSEHRGRGLSLIEALCPAVKMHSDSGGTIVSMRCPLVPEELATGTGA